MRNERLTRARELRGWSQARVGEAVGVHSKQISAWERGESTPTPAYREKLCVLFGLDAEALGFVSPVVVARHESMEGIMLDQAESIVNLAWAAWFASRPQQAQNEMLKLLPRLAKMRHSPGSALQGLRAQNLAIRCHGLLGGIYLDAMQNDTALHHYQQARTLASEIHDQDQSATYLALIGDVLRRKNDKLAAIARMELARDEAELASRATQGHILQLLAYTYADTGRGDEFERTISEATDLLAHTGEGLDAAQHEFIPFEIFEIRGKANRDLGRPLQAIPYLESAEKSLAGQLVTPRWHALLEISRAQAFCDAGDLATGVDLAMRGFTMARACQSPRQANRVRKLLRKLESGEQKDSRQVGSLRDLLYAHYLSE